MDAQTSSFSSHLIVLAPAALHREAWRALLDVFLFWIGHGITIFRVDNPHTKPFPFWEWVTSELRQRHRPERETPSPR